MAYFSTVAVLLWTTKHRVDRGRFIDSLLTNSAFKKKKDSPLLSFFIVWDKLPALRMGLIPFDVVKLPSM